jgi:hypothetical protein
MLQNTKYNYITDLVLGGASSIELRNPWNSWDFRMSAYVPIGTGCHPVRELAQPGSGAGYQLVSFAAAENIPGASLLGA